MTAICAEYEAKLLRDFKQLKQFYINAECVAKGSLSFEEFSKLCLDIDNKTSFRMIKDSFKNAKSISENSDIITPDAFAFTCQKYNIGGYGAGVFNFSQPLSRIVDEEEIIQMSLSPSKVQTSKVSRSKRKTTKKKE